VFAACLWISLAHPSWARSEDSTLVVSVPVANMYSKASEDAEVVSQAIYGSPLKVLEESEGWARVRTADDYTGWVRLDAARRRSSDDPVDHASPKTVWINTQLANLYRETDVTAHRPMLSLPFETRLEVEKEGTGDHQGWFEVRLLDGRTAWIQAGDVIVDSHSLTIEEAIALAKRFLGVTYLWGGRSSLGYDCSGFTQMLVRSRGINMPRDADLQAAWNGVEPVDRKRLRPGDLLFFGSSADHITHTGMYIGHGQFIHDTTHGHPGVQISRLRDQPWTQLLVACRRVK